MASKYAVMCLLQQAQAAVFSSDMSTTACFSATVDTSDTKVYPAQWCLDADSWTTGQCCDTTVDTTADDVPAGKCAVAPQYDTTAAAFNS